MIGHEWKGVRKRISLMDEVNLVLLIFRGVFGDCRMLRVVINSRKNVRVASVA